MYHPTTNQSNKLQILKTLIILCGLVIGTIFSLLIIIPESEASNLESILSESIPISSRNFYIDSINGNDNWDGRSENYTSEKNGPWKTLNNVDRSTSFIGGDNIYLRRGRTWNISVPFIFRSQGSSGNPIRLSAYGTGARPIVQGTGNGSTYIQQGNSHVILESWEICNMNGNGVVSESLQGTRYNITFHDLVIHDIAEGKIGLHNPRYKPIIGLRITNCTIYNIKYGGIAIMGTPGPDRTSNVEVSNNKLYNIGGDAFTIHEGSSSHIYHAGSNFSIHNNTIRGAKNDGFDITTGSNIHLHNNIISDCGGFEIFIDHSSRDVKVYNNYIYNTQGPGAVYISVPDVLFYGNLVIGNGKYRTVIWAGDDNTNSDVIVSNITLMGNTLISNGELDTIRISNVYGRLGKVNIKNNIISSGNGGPPLRWIFFEHSTYSPSNTNFFCDYNIYGPNEFIIAEYGKKNCNLTYWNKNYGHDKNGRNVDPFFVNR